jgi:hypothetical protein
MRQILQRAAFDPVAFDHLDAWKLRYPDIAVHDARDQQFHRPGTHQSLILFHSGHAAAFENLGDSRYAQVLGDLEAVSLHDGFQVLEFVV